MSRDFYRLFAGGDFHDGHFAGLTPPGRHYALDGARGAIGVLQRETWGWFDNEINRLKPFDGASLMGDLIDGDGAASGGTELITTDRNEQVEMACKVVETIGAKHNRFVYGTAYHTGKHEDFENQIAQRFGAEISDQA